MIDYQDVVRHAHTGGLLLLAASFVIAVAYALWPANRDKFKIAARAPLESEDDNV